MSKINLNTFLKIFGLFLISRLLLFISFYVALNYFNSYSVRADAFNYSTHKLLNSLGCWDSGWYINVARNGYVKKAFFWDQSNYGFFPFYPMAMKIVALFAHDEFIAGIIVSNMLLFFGSVFLYLLCLKLYRSNLTAILAITVLYFFPGSYLLSGVFSESSFICFSIMCIYFFEKDNYFLSGVSGFFLTLTRPFGLLILLPLGISYILKNGINFRAKSLFLTLIPMGMLSFFGYCYITTGDFLFYVHSKQIGWHTEYDNPWNVLISGLNKTNDLYVRFNSFYTLFWLLISVLLIRYIPFYLTLWIVLLTIAPLSNGGVNLICMPRYILVCFPLFLTVAAFATKYKWAGGILIFILAIANLVLGGFFALGYQFTA